MRYRSGIIFGLMPSLPSLRRYWIGLALLCVVRPAAAQTRFEAWNYFDVQHRLGASTWTHATAKLKWRNRGTPAWFYYGGEVGVQHAVLPRLRLGVNYILLRTAPGPRYFRDERVDLDGEAYLAQGFRNRVRYEYRWFRPASGGVWRDRLLWVSPAERRVLRPEASFEFFYDPQLGRPSDQRYAMGGTLTRLRLPVEVMYAYDRYALGSRWLGRNLLMTYLHVGR